HGTPSGAIGIVLTSFQFILFSGKFLPGIDIVADFPRFRISCFGGNKWRNMIKIPIVLVVGHDKNGFFPDLWIFSQNVHHLRDVPGTIPGCPRVIGEILGAQTQDTAGSWSSSTSFRNW